MPDSISNENIASQVPSDTLAVTQWLHAADETPEEADVADSTFLQLAPGCQVTPLTHFASIDDIHTPFFTLEEVPLPRGEGQTGTLIPYSFRNDDYLTGALLLCFFLVAWVISSSWHYFKINLSSLFRPAGTLLKSTAEHTNTEYQSTLFLLLQTVFCFSILYYDFLNQNKVAEVQAADNPYLIMAISGGIFFAYFIVKTGLYQIVNSVFFSKASCQEWRATYVFSAISMGLLILPVTLLVFFFDLAFEKQFVAFICIVCITKLILFYRCWRTFFNCAGRCLHLILYLCALEIVPALILWRALFWANSNLIIL